MHFASADLLPAALAFTSAVLFALGLQISNLGLQTTASSTGALVHIVTTTMLYAVLAPWFVEASYWFTGATLLFAAVGLFRPALSANLALLGVRHLGPTLTSTLAATSPLFGVAFGILLIGERLTVSVALGTLAVVGGTIMLARGGRMQSGWALWALLFPLGAAFFRSAGHALTKLGYEEVPSPLFAALVSYIVSCAIGLIVTKFQRRKADRPASRAGILWFVLAGLVNGLSLLSLNTALHLGKIITVVPIVSTSPMITMLLGILVFRRETFRLSSLLAIAVIVPGIIAIALSR